MCLILGENAVELTAVEDVCCYKIVVHDEDEYGLPTSVYLTYYQKAVVKLNNIYESELVLDTDCFNGDEVAVVEQGLHSFTNLVDAKFFKSEKVRIFAFDEPDILIIKCVIPKGSKYYQGIFRLHCRNNMQSFASDRLVYQEVVG